MLNDIYTDSILKFPLNQNQTDDIDKVWEFIKCMNIQDINVSEIRRKAIKKVSKRYTVEEFTRYEQITEKMLWNLRWLLYPLWIKKHDTNSYWNYIKNDDKDSLPRKLTLVDVKECDNKNKCLKDIIKRYITTARTVYYRSFVNKVFVVEGKNVYVRPVEGSLDVLAKNSFNLVTGTLLFNRKLYESVMKDPLKILTIKIKYPKYYYQLDYVFPNLNFSVYLNRSFNERLCYVQKMYYASNAETNWFIHHYAVCIQKK